MPNQKKDVSTERISEKLSQSSKKKGVSGKLLLLIGIVVVVIAVISVVIILAKPSVKEERNVLVTPDNVDEILADLEDDQRTEAGQYEVKMNSTWNFKDGSSASSNAYVENSTSNQNDVYFDIVRSDNGETIFSSPTIPVGSHLESIALDKVLKAGTYPCVLTYHLLDESGNSVSKLDINLTINVEK